MPWSGSSYTKANGTAGWAGDASNNIGIEAGRHDTQDTDFQDGINACLNKNGLNSPTTNLPMGGFRHTGVGNGVARTDYAAVGQVQDSSVQWGGTSGGTSTAFTISLTPAITAYAAGQVIRWIANAAVTGAATINVNSLGTKTLQRQGTALAGNEFKANDIVEMVYDGTNFQITSVVPAPLFVNRTNNRVGIGTTAPATDLDVSGTSTVISNYRYEAGSNGGQLSFLKSRGATVGTNTIVQSGDNLGAIYFSGANGSSYDFSCGIAGAALGTIAAGRMPGALTFLTVPDVQGGGLTERMRITPAGEVYIAGTVDQGAYNLQVNGTGVWGAGAYVNGSDERIKKEITPIANCLSLVGQLNPVTFKYKESWTSDQRVQSGFIAQELKATLANENYLEGLVNEEGQFLSVAYQNLIPVLTKAIQELNAKVEALEARVEELEG